MSLGVLLWRIIDWRQWDDFQPACVVIHGGEVGEIVMSARIGALLGLQPTWV
jgi:hypothetical protein